MKKPLVLIIVFLCGLSGFSVYRYLDINTELGRKIRQITELKGENLSIIRKLEKQIAEGMQLTREKKALEKEISVNNKKLNQLKIELTSNKHDFLDLKRISEELSKDNQLLRQKQADLGTKIDLLLQERDTLKATLSSLKGLKQAIRDLKRSKKTKVNKEDVAVEEIKEDDKNYGNRGYLMYRGKSTGASRFSIQVMPAE